MSSFFNFLKSNYSRIAVSAIFNYIGLVLYIYMTLVISPLIFCGYLMFREYYCIMISYPIEYSINIQWVASLLVGRPGIVTMVLIIVIILMYLQIYATVFYLYLLEIKADTDRSQKQEEQAFLANWLKAFKCLYQYCLIFNVVQLISLCVYILSYKNILKITYYKEFGPYFIFHSLCLAHALIFLIVMVLLFAAFYLKVFKDNNAKSIITIQILLILLKIIMCSLYLIFICGWIFGIYKYYYIPPSIDIIADGAAYLIVHVMGSYVYFARNYTRN